MSYETNPGPLATVVDVLVDASAQIEDRAKSRDIGGKLERSMARTVAIFNATEGTNLTEHQGWVFMECLKMARRKAGALNGVVTRDDYVDKVAYTALAFEAATRPQQGPAEDPDISRLKAELADAGTPDAAEKLKAQLADAMDERLLRKGGLGM